MNSRLFRQVSLERLSSPEQLDQVLRITRPKRWAALLAVFLLLATAVVWGYKGRITTTASGEAVIVRSGGVLNVVTRGGGVVVEMRAKVGAKIEANQVIAVIAQPVLAEQTRAMRATVDEALRERDHALQVHRDSAKLQITAIERQKENAERRISELEEQLKLTNEEIAGEEQLLAKGLVTKQQLLGVKQKRIEMADQIAGLRVQLKQFEAQTFELQSRPQEDDSASRIRISNLQRDLAGMEKQMSLAESVVSPYRGQVLELKVSSGSTVSMGQPVLSIQPDEDHLEVLAYLPSSRTKEARIGMEVQVSPAAIKREEYGFMKGEITYVSDYPATTAALMRNFENESLVQALGGGGPITEIRVALVRDTSTPSGFSWSTSKGPSLNITSGTICSVQVVTRRQRPISLVFPYLKEKLGMS